MADILQTTYLGRYKLALITASLATRTYYILIIGQHTSSFKVGGLLIVCYVSTYVYCARILAICAVVLGSLGIFFIGMVYLSKYSIIQCRQSNIMTFLRTSVSAMSHLSRYY